MPAKSRTFAGGSRLSSAASSSSPDLAHLTLTSQHPREIRAIRLAWDIVAA